MSLLPVRAYHEIEDICTGQWAAPGYQFASGSNVHLVRERLILGQTSSTLGWPCGTVPDMPQMPYRYHICEVTRPGSMKGVGVAWRWPLHDTTYRTSEKVRLFTSIEAVSADHREDG